MKYVNYHRMLLLMWSLAFISSTRTEIHNTMVMIYEKNLFCVCGGEFRVGDLRICKLTYIKNSLVKLKRANKEDFKENFLFKNNYINILPHKLRKIFMKFRTLNHHHQ